MKENPVIEAYGRFDEEQRAGGDRAGQIEFTYTKRLLSEYIDASKTVIELGCATGYYGLFLSGKCKAYHGIDLVPKHIERFKAKIREQQLTNVSASLGDATHLPAIQDNACDVVLVFGPMYHLPGDQRQKVIAESKRICKGGGLIFFAYINKAGAYLRACIDADLKAGYPNKKTNQSVLVDGVDDKLPNVFFYTMPEEIEQDAIRNGLSVLRNAGVDYAFSPSDINNMNPEQYAAWTELMDFLYNSSSCTGTSNHAVLVCRKNIG